MKSKLKSKVFILLVALICLITCLTLPACANDNKSGEGNMKETEYYLIENGVSDYKIVYPEEHGSYIDYAVDELRNFMGEATNGVFRTGSDKGLTHTAEGKYISLGDTSLLASSGIEVDKEALGSDGYKIVTKDQSVYLIGGSTHGTLFAAYEFLEKQFGYHFYAENCYDLERNVGNKKLLDFNLTKVPSIGVRYMADGPLVKNLTAQRRLRSTPVDELLILSSGSGWHTAGFFVSPSKYIDKYPQYFSYNLPEGESENTYYYNALKNGGQEAAYKQLQLCYSGRPNADGEKAGDADQEPLIAALTSEMTMAIDNQIADDKNDSDLFVCLTPADNFDWCECDYCKEIEQAYGGSKAASYIVVANEVANRLQAHMDEHYNGRKITVFIFAYQQTEQPPVRKNADGSYEAILDGPYGEKIKLNDNVALLYAPIAADYSKTFNDPVNEVEGERMEQWKLLADKIAMWTYDKTFYNDYFVPNNPYNSMDENMRYYVENGAIFLQAQGQTYNDQLTDWGNLKVYLSAQLSWDCTQDIEELIDKFFKGYFQDAAPAMREWFDDFRQWHTSQSEKFWGETWYDSQGRPFTFNYRGTSGGTKTINKAFYPYDKLKQWKESLGKAYEAIEKYKTSDLSLYNKLEKRITRESVSLNYLITSIHRSEFDNITEYRDLLLKVYQDADKTGIVFWREVSAGSGRPESYFTVKGKLQELQG